MLYRIITGDRPLTVFIIFLIALGIWIPAFLSNEIIPYASSSDAMPLYVLLASALEKLPFLNRFFALFLVLLEAFMLVRINARFVLIQQRNFLPALFFIIVAGHAKDLLQLNPALFGAFFIILVLFIIFLSYRDEADSYRFFEAGLALGLGSLFYAPLIWFLVFIWIASAVQRPFFWREYFFPLIGLLVPYAVVFAYLFLSEKSIPELITVLISNLHWISSFPDFNWTYWVFAVYLTLIILIASIFLLKVFQFRKIYIRDYFMVLFWLFNCASAIFIFLSNYNRGMTYIIAIPVSFIFTNYFINARKNFGNKLLLYILLIYIAFLTIYNILSIS
jgi:hypothetical protein